MNIIAIICEYNPFHLGHQYQIKKIREEYPDSAVVSIMSGSITQRGDMAVFDKYARAKIATLAGVDLVVELPAPWSFTGAQFFASAGITIAKRIGADRLAFGSESGDIAMLSKAAENIDSPRFTEALAKARKSDPTVQAGALRASVYRELFGECEAFTGSNDLLAIEYLLALNRSNLSNSDKQILPVCIRRIGENYNSDNVNPSNQNVFSSASAIRKNIYALSDISSQIPKEAKEVYNLEISSRRIHRLSNLDTTVTAFLRLAHHTTVGKMEVSGGIENRLHNASLKYAAIDEIVECSLERRYSASRLRRAILASMLDFTMADVESAPLFSNVLAANRVGCRILADIRKTDDGFFLTKPASFISLDSAAKKQFEKNLKAEELFTLSSDNLADRSADSLLKKGPFIVS